MNRMTLGIVSAVAAAVLAACAAQAPREVAFAPGIEEASVAGLRQRMAAGETSAEALTQAYLDRIEALDRNGPKLRSVIATNPDALAEARKLDEERQAGQVRGPLHGIPVLVKDNVETAGRMATTAGSLALAESVTGRDAFLVARLREAGAVILGKTNLSEWANFRSIHSTSGWSGVGGQARNPYDPARSPCGSSSGSGAAIAASLGAIAIGTETDGSILCPAGVNGIVGLKPTVGLVSRGGIVPISASQDTAGPMTRTVADAAAMLGALTAIDPKDPAMQVPGRKAHDNYLPFLQRDALRGARIGVVRDLAGYKPGVDRVLEQAIEVMKAQGAIVVDPVAMPTLKEIDADEWQVLQYEFKDGLNAYLASLPATVKAPRSLAELITFNEMQADRELKHFGQDIFVLSQAKGPLTDKAYRKARARSWRKAGPEGIDKALREHQLDALLAPTTSAAWTMDYVNGDHYVGGSSTAAAVAGYPSISVPAGFDRGLPIGITLFAGAWSEPRLLALAYAFEQAANARKPPALTEAP